MNTFHKDSATNRRTSSNEHGFTLIELLVVMAFLAVLPGLLIPAIQDAREEAAHTLSSANVNQLAIASQEYRNRRGSYPRSVDDLILANVISFEVAQGRTNGYLYEIVESDQDHCRIEAKPEYPGITGTFVFGAVVTSNSPIFYKVCSAGAHLTKERMLNNIRDKAAETVARLLGFDNSATSHVRGYVESPDTINGVFNTLDGDDDGRVSVEEILTSSSAIPDAQLRSPVEEFLAYVAREMKLDSLSAQERREIAVGIAEPEDSPAIQTGNWIFDVSHSKSSHFSYDGLCLLTKLWINQSEISNSLCATLEAAEAAEASGDLRGRNKAIQKYQRQVGSQVGEAITASDAKRLLTLLEIAIENQP